MEKRIIMHLDMDAFFAAIEERNKPWLKDKPIVVGSDPNEGKGRGVVSTANYKAREYGIHSALPISIAWQHSEEAYKKGQSRVVFLSPGIGRYGKVSNEIMQYLRTKVKIIEQASVDEAYLELKFQAANSKLQWKEAETLAREIQGDIWKNQKLTCSIGIGPNKFIAKVASDFKKPNGLTVITDNEVSDFLAPLPIKVIPGIGPKAQEKLSRLQVKTIRDLRTLSEERLKSLFGKWGIEMWKRARGIHEGKVVTSRVRKSIGEQTTFSEDTLDATVLVERLKQLIASMCETVKQKNVAFKTVSLIVRFSDFETKTRAKSLLKPTNDIKTIETIALGFLLPFLDARENPKRKRIRLLGVRVEKLSTAPSQRKML